MLYDSHMHTDHRDNACRNFAEAMQSLKSLGFTHYHYYKNRKPQAIDL